MGKRKQPFGYKMKLGEIVPQPQEAEAVRSIYLQYLAGASFKQLAEQLQTEDVPYQDRIIRCSHHGRYPTTPAGTGHAATDTACR